MLTELLRVLRADGIAPTAENCEPVSQLVPDAIARAVVGRLRRLGSAPARLASATAVLGSSAPLRHAATLARLDPEGAVVAADDLTAAGILRDGRPLQFIHPIVCGAVYRDIPTGRRAMLHKRVAACLQRDGLRAADIAPHLLASEPSGDANVVERLRAAAGEVRLRGAPDAACAYLERALAEPPAPALQSTVTYEFGSAELAAGRPSAITHLQRALEGDLDLATQAAVRVDISTALVTSGRIQESVDVLDAAISALAAGGQADALLERHPYGPSFQLAATTLGYADRLERVDELFTLAVERAQAQGSLLSYTLAIVPRCLGWIRQGRLADAETDARSCLGSARRTALDVRPPDAAGVRAGRDGGAHRAERLPRLPRRAGDHG